MIKVLFFAAIREQLDTNALEVEAKGINTVADIKKLLAQKGELWQQVFANATLLNAVNEQMVNDDTVVKDSDTIAFFPPVTGG